MNRITGQIFRTGAALSAALVVCAPLAAPQALAQARRVHSEADLDRAVAALRSIATLQANFVQTDANGRSAKGVLTLKRPGRIRFQYEPGIPMLIVSDGAAMTFVDYETRQVQRWPIGKSPLGALLDPSRDVAKYGRLIVANALQLVIEVRDRSHPEYGTITLRFARDAAAPGGLELLGWVTLDSQNRQTAITLSGQRYGVPVSDRMFKFNDPRRPARR